MASELYRAVAQAAFALLGLWWVVVQFRYREWIPDASARRAAYGISLHFLIPGVISLMAIAAPAHDAVWRISFGVAAVIGVAEVVRRFLARGTAGTSAGSLLAVAVLGAGYVLVALLALHTALLKDLGIHLQPLEAEGILVGILLLAGVNLAWLAFTAPEPGA